jgi:hypothetical protein
VFTKLFTQFEHARYVTALKQHYDICHAIVNVVPAGTIADLTGLENEELVEYVRLDWFHAAIACQAAHPTWADCWAWYKDLPMQSAVFASLRRKEKA